MKRFAALFENRTLAITTCLLWFQWTTVGMGYPLFNAFLPQYLANSGGDVTNDVATVYRNYAITAIVGVPGSLLACYTVDLKYIGRKGTMASGTVITGVFVFLFTISSDSDFQLAFTCLEAFFQNIMYGVLYAYTVGFQQLPSHVCLVCVLLVCLTGARQNKLLCLSCFLLPIERQLLLVDRSTRIHLIFCISVVLHTLPRSSLRQSVVLVPECRVSSTVSPVSARQLLPFRLVQATPRLRSTYQEVSLSLLSSACCYCPLRLGASRHCKSWAVAKSIRRRTRDRV